MKDGAPVGLVRDFWFDGSVNLACERLQPERVLGQIAACTTAARRGREAREMDNIMIRYNKSSPRNGCEMRNAKGIGKTRVSQSTFICQ